MTEETKQAELAKDGATAVGAGGVNVGGGVSGSINN
jgi:hypothetical protein